MSENDYHWDAQQGAMEELNELQEPLADKIMRWCFYTFFVFPGFVMICYVAYQLWF